MEQNSILENNFWRQWPAFAVDVEVVSEFPFRLSDRADNMKLHLAVNACWLSLMTNVYKTWEDCVCRKNETGSFPAESPFVRKKMIDAWIELELARSVQDVALSPEATVESLRLARVWVIRCLKIFVLENSVYINSAEAPWQLQAQKFIQGMAF